MREKSPDRQMPGNRPEDRQAPDHEGVVNNKDAPIAKAGNRGT